MSAFDQYLNICSNLNIRIATLLNPGISNSEQVLISGFVLPIELQSLYSWKNGTGYAEGLVVSQTWFIPPFEFLSLEQSMSVRKELELDATCIPILFDFTGSVIYANSTDEANVSALTLWRFDESDDRVLIYDSVSRMVTTSIECITNGAFIVSNNGSLRTHDVNKVNQISQRLNPKSNVYWQQRIERNRTS